MKLFKNSLVLLPVIFFISTYLVNAEDYDRKGYSEDLYNFTQNVTQEQLFKHFMLELFNPCIVEAAQGYYKDKSISGLAFDWEDNYNVVEINQSFNQDEDNKYSFLVKFTVIVHSGSTMKDHKVHGIDTLTFGINPNLIGLKEIDGYPSIKLHNYEHREPQN